MSEFLSDLVAAFQMFANALRWEIERARTALRAAEERDQRAAKLRAYKLRHRWNGGDEKRLRAVGADGPALQRLRRVKAVRPRGRPTVEFFLPLYQRLAMTMKIIEEFYDPNTPPHERRKILKRTKWWPYFVEAVYRGELARAQSEGRPSASFFAEEKAGRALGIAPDTVRKVAGQVRKERAAGAPPSGFPSMTVEDYQAWERTAQFCSEEKHHSEPQ